MLVVESCNEVRLVVMMLSRVDGHVIGCNEIGCNELYHPGSFTPALSPWTPGTVL